MAFLVANLPRVECFVRKEFIYDLQPDPADPNKLKAPANSHLAIGSAARVC